MTTPTIEVESLDELTLDDVPPCTVMLGDDQHECGKPAVCRIRTVCSCPWGHGKVKHDFLCLSCLMYLRLGWYRCGLCKLRDPLEWRMS
jgi:hypothetical protein